MNECSHATLHYLTEITSYRLFCQITTPPPLQQTPRSPFFQLMHRKCNLVRHAVAISNNHNHYSQVRLSGSTSISFFQNVRYYLIKLSTLQMCTDSSSESEFSIRNTVPMSALVAPLSDYHSNRLGTIKK